MLFLRCMQIVQRSPLIVITVHACIALPVALLSQNLPPNVKEKLCSKFGEYMYKIALH